MFLRSTWKFYMNRVHSIWITYIFYLNLFKGFLWIRHRHEPLDTMTKLGHRKQMTIYKPRREGSEETNHLTMKKKSNYARWWMLLTKLLGVIISQHICTSNHHTVHLKFTQCYVSYMAIKQGETLKRKKLALLTLYIGLLASRIMKK